MAMGPINIVSMARSQDYTVIKQNEDNKAATMQMTMGEQEDKALKQRAKQVLETEETKWQQKKFDAKEKGDNQYSSDGGKNRKKTEQVVVKGQPQPKGFDVKI